MEFTCCHQLAILINNTLAECVVTCLSTPKCVSQTYHSATLVAATGANDNLFFNFTLPLSSKNLNKFYQANDYKKVDLKY